LRARAAECITDGLFRTLTAREAAIRSWATAHGLITLQLAGRLGMARKSFDALYDATMEALL
jgi:hypothetical protein